MDRLDQQRLDRHTGGTTHPSSTPDHLADVPVGHICLQGHFHAFSAIGSNQKGGDFLAYRGFGFRERPTILLKRV
jgi:hypothetical protein